MQTLQGIRTSIQALLLADPRFGSVRVITEFSDGTAVIPREQPTLAIGLEQIEAVPGGFGAYLGRADEVGHCGLDAQIVLRFDGFFPRDQEISSWDSLFEGLCECLLSSDLGITKVWQEPTKANPAQHATQTCAKAAMQALLTMKTQTQQIKEFEVQYNLEQNGNPR